ncbi:hypothetical protein [Arsenicicoccus piscis]|uniref:ABC-2 type transporter domain-containing protein n=1 Tax=Arsenicicoccus piscis TaxID=673954 RepID=A0ABQ6HU15_9MICO|nr:hypothetical protein [Arsenicicoccus piscis]GMA21882.1 hypothetical protein GCM10025862_39030 [Arsenicicoccus piscis]
MTSTRPPLPKEPSDDRRHHPRQRQHQRPHQHPRHHPRRPRAHHPRFGGLNLTLLRIEVVRTLRNTRTLIFTIGLPVAFFFIFGTNAEYADMRSGNGNVSAYIMIGMALYGALMATTGAGAAVSAERAQGWSRQLRLTPSTRSRTC